MQMKINTPAKQDREGSTISPKARSAWFAVAAIVLVCGVAAMLNWPGTVLATTPSGLTTDATKSTFEKIRVISRMDDAADEGNDWKVKILAQEDSDVYVVNNTFQAVTPSHAGGSTGWHTHPGPSVVLVKSGVATVYDGDDPSCRGVKYAAGSGFIDAGGGHIHLVRNEGTEPLVTVAFQIIPAGAMRRIEAASPGNCRF
jgi:quercetin dioxygenase-like cupin family protein